MEIAGWQCRESGNFAFHRSIVRRQCPLAYRHLVGDVRSSPFRRRWPSPRALLLDGRDVPPTSALEYVEQLETKLKQVNQTGNRDYRIASGGGRLYITMDRYNADWPMVERGWNTHVKGVGRTFGSATEAIETLRAEDPGVIDQDLKSL